MEWKQRSMKSASSSSTVDKNEHAMFKPTIFTSKDTLSKYRVESKTKELTIQAGNVHVERYEKARLAKAEAEKKLYGTGKAKPVQTMRPGYSLKMTTNLHSSSRPRRTMDTAASDTTSKNTTSSDNSTFGESIEHEEEQTEKPSTVKNSGEETRWGVGLEEDGRKSRERQSADNVEIDVEDIAVPEINMTLKEMEEHLSIVQVLERERREWHAERAKLTHCIHLQQVELASRSSAAQETAAIIAQEFARAIQSFEERLEKVETATHKELIHVKEILMKSK